MQFKIPKNTKKHQWTQHAIYKLRQYGLSAQRVIRVINNPQRKEEGIAPKTIAVMQPASTKTKNGKRTWSQEIWAMYQLHKARQFSNKNLNLKIKRKDDDKLAKLENNQIKIISVWRYPGISPEKNPIPDEILREIDELSV